MAVVLLMLCGLFSALTFQEQSPNDPTAARGLARDLLERCGPKARILIVVRDQPEDQPFAAALRDELTRSGVRVLQTVSGEPRDARAALQELAANNQPLDAIACNAFTASWLVFSNVPGEHPALGNPAVLQPGGSKWPSFLNRSNLINIADQTAVIAIIAIGMTMVIISGGIDLSVGSLVALAAVLCALFIRECAGAEHASAAGMVAAAAAAILICALVGAISGGVITLFDIPPFIVTLAMMLVGSGLAYLLAQGQSVYQVPNSFIRLGRGADIAGIPNSVLLMLGLYGVAHLVMKHTRFGRHLYAVGGNREAAVVSGVRVRGVLLGAYVLSGALAGLGGVVMASQLKSGSPTYGQMYELFVIAAVVVGGASLSGGQGRMFGTLVGAFIIAVIQNGMNLTNVESYTQKVVLGCVVLAAVMIDRVKRRMV